jgi:Ras-related protein Rab-7A
MVNNVIVTVQIWDTAGQEKYHSIGYAFYRGADCCVLTFDLTKRKSFEMLDKWREGFIDHAGAQDPENFPFVVMGNKCDKQDRQVSQEEAQNWCKENGNIPYFETSAIANMNVDDAFFSIIKKAVDAQDSNAIEMPDSIGVVGGANIQLSARNNSQASPYKRKKKCKC